jgi:lipoprotein-anchoring transpeptidase ErfK/SrfK
LARHDDRALAQGRFARILAMHPDHIEALLWLAALEQDPRQSVSYLNRVLQVSPGEPRAIAGLRWARQRLRARSAPPPPAPARTPMPLLDRFLLAGIIVVSIAACVLWALVLWDAPAAVRAAYQPSPTGAPATVATPTASLTPTPAPTYTVAVTYPVTAPLVTPAATPTLPAEAALTTPDAGKQIVIDLSEQRLTAYEGDELLLSALVSTGISWYPTPPGEYEIISKVRRQVMSGPGYRVPNVEWVSYFFKSYAIHGTYWHDNFGQPMSHGCINMTNDDAQWLYGWAPLGTPVIVRP